MKNDLFYELFTLHHPLPFDGTKLRINQRKNMRMGSLLISVLWKPDKVLPQGIKTMVSKRIASEVGLH